MEIPKNAHQRFQEEEHWWYCWWTKSYTTKDDDYPIICRVLTIPGGAGFCPSTVSISKYALLKIYSYKVRCIHLEPQWPLLLKVNDPKQGLFQVYIMHMFPFLDVFPRWHDLFLPGTWTPESARTIGVEAGIGPEGVAPHQSILKKNLIRYTGD